MMHVIYLLIRAIFSQKTYDACNLLTYSCYINPKEDDRNDKNRLNKIGMNNNNLIHSFTNFKIKYNSSLVKALNILN